MLSGAGMEGMNKRERSRLMGCQDLIDVIHFVDGKWGLGEKVSNPLVESFEQCS
jgi:hypothetical protein